MPRKISADDFMRIQLLSDPQVSPDGNLIAFVKRRIDPEKNRTRGEIWVVPTEGGEPRRFTGGERSDSSPRWSPDGARIAFLSDREKPKNQIFVIAADGGEGMALTKLEAEGGIQGIRWSPDGARIAFLFRATPDAWRKEAVEERGKKELPAPPRVHTRLNYRSDGSGYIDDSYWQVWTADARTGECLPLTAGEFHCSAPVWSPDSATLAFLSDRREDADITPSDPQIWTVAAAGGELTHIPTPPGAKHALAWSPDGRWFAYAGNPSPDDAWGTNNDRLFVLPSEGGDTARDLTGQTDQSLGYLTLSDCHDAGAGDLIQWNANATALFFAMSAFGSTRLYVTEPAGGAPLAVSPEGREMGGFALTTDGRALVVLGSATEPAELFVLYGPQQTGRGVEARPRTHFNSEWAAEVQVVTPGSVAIPNGEGGEVPAWILRPPDFDPARKYPFVLYVHGGPHLQYGNVLFHELQFLAAEGYVVIYPNPRGSKGYGEAHTKAIRGAWGGADFRDIMAVADYGCALPYVDPARTAIMGGSYGGYMTAWAVGHTDRFRCAITDRLVGNLQSMAGTCDFTWRPDSYFEGDAWSRPADLWRCSPLAYAADIHTPLLIIHSDGDLRCPISQAEELFSALRLQRKTVEFVRYPAETSHGMSRNGPPGLRLDRLNRNRDWLDRWLK